MRHNAIELWIAAGLMLAVTAIYAAVVTAMNATLAGSSLFGHGIGIAGFILMLMTETLYSFRKRSRLARWGRPAAWLRFHIVTGLVGPYMVLLHASWKYNGLAAAAMLMTVIVTLSGVIGRYIYTRIPRTASGEELAVADYRAAAIANARRLLGTWHTIHVPLGYVLFTLAFIHVAAALYFATFAR
jgi:hypothetical protein